MSIFQSLIPSAHVNHNVFDTSRRDVGSFKSAMVTPHFVLHTVPNATYEISPSNQIEVSTMARANFARLKQNVEYYFVPYNHLWKWFESFYYQRTDAVRSPSNVSNPVVPSSVPYFKLGALLNYLFHAYWCTRLCYETCEILWSAFQSEVTSYAFGDSFVEFYQDFYSSWSYSIISPLVLTDSEGSQGIDVGLLTDQLHGRLCVEDILRFLDNLGYGNWLPVFEHHFEYVLANYGIDYDPELAKPGDVVFDEGTFYSIEEFANGILERSKDAEGFYNKPIYLTTIGIIDQGNQDYYDENCRNSTLPWYESTYKSFSAFPILGYLKVWTDNFRNTQYDDTNYSYYFNMDYKDGHAGTSLEIPLYRILMCLLPRYRMYRRDILTGTYPNTQFGDVSIASLQNPSTINFGGSTTGSARNVTVPANSSDVTLAGVSGTNKWNINSGISALAIRQAEALQRYKEKNLRAGSKLVNQQKAFFGDTSRYLQDDYSTFLWSNDSDILINTVVATGESNEISLGDKGSIAVSAMSSKSFKFESHDFGMIIGVMYIMPMAEYENFGFDPQVKKLENGDFFHEDLQNIGLAPVFSDIVCGFSPDQQSMPSVSVLGYSAHDWEYKTNIDRVHGQFNRDRGVFGDYVTPRDSKDFVSQKLSNLYCSPSDVDSIFLQAADYRQSSDQFKVNSYHQIKAILPMSVTGLPY